MTTPVSQVEIIDSPDEVVELSIFEDQLGEIIDSSDEVVELSIFEDQISEIIVLEGSATELIVVEAPGAQVTAVSDDLPLPLGTASAGSSVGASRSNHVHAHGNQVGGSLHALATAGAAGFMPSADKAKLEAATSANTPNTIVLRDANGDFIARQITATLIGNASTATKLSSARSFTLTGDVTGTASNDLQSGFSIVTAIGSRVIVNANISNNAEIAVSKLADGSSRQLLQTNAAGTGVEWASNIDIPGTLDVTGTATFDGDAIVQGDLTINGTTTIINIETLLVEDKNIELGVVATPTDITANGGGVILKGATDKTFNWLDATDSWTSSENLDLIAGKAYKIAGANVISSTALGSGVVSSGLTSVGTLTGGTWQANVIGPAYGGTGVAGAFSGGDLLIGKTDGSLAKAKLSAGTGITITNGNGTIQISSQISSQDPVSAGDGLDLAGGVFSLDLKSNGGLVIESTELALDLGASAITGTLGTADGGTGQTTYTNGQLLIGNTLGGLTKATVTAGANVSITNGNGAITIAAVDTTYTAGNGLDLSGTEFALDLKANGGLVIQSTELALDLGASSINGTLGTADGGTGQTTYTNGQLLIGKTDGTLAKATLTQGDATTITNGDGSITIDLPTGVVSTGTYKSVTVDTYGRVTNGSNPTTLSGYGITDALSNSTTSTQDGYFGDIYLRDDSTPSNYLRITNSGNLTADKSLSIDIKNSNRTISLNGHLTVSSAATISGTNSGDQTITLTGAVTGSGDGSFTTTLSNDIVFNANVAAAAAIAGTKISPDFGAQNIVTTGDATASKLVATSSTQIGSSGSGTKQNFVGTVTKVAATTGQVIFKFKCNIANARSCLIQVALSNRVNNNQPFNSAFAKYAFQLHTTATGVCSLNGEAVLYEYEYAWVNHFAFANLGSYECTIAFTNPSAFIIAIAYEVEILTVDGAWTLESITTA